MSNINAESVKAKLQSLITASNAKTGKSDVNLTDAVKTLLEGYGKGGSECDKPHVIEVEELPEVGEIGKVYKLIKKDIVSLAQRDEEGFIMPDILGAFIIAFGGEIPDEFYNYVKEADIDSFIPECFYYVENEDAIYVYNDGAWGSIKNGGEEGFRGVVTSIEQITEPGLYAVASIEYEYYECIQETFKAVNYSSGNFIYLDTIAPIISVPTRPTDNIIMTGDDSSIIYYVKNEDDFLHYNGTEWESIKSSNNPPTIVNDLNEITEDGSYIVRSGNYIRYLNPVEEQTITESGMYDVTDTKMLTVDVDSISGAWKLKYSDMGMYGTVYVNFTTVLDNQAVKCIGMRYEEDLGDIDDFYYILEDGTEHWVEFYTDGVGEGQYVDFGKEKQVVPVAFANFVREGSPIYELLIEIETESLMNAILETAEIGAVYKYIGPTTENYQNGALYVVHLPMVSFTIDGADHQGEEDMTWAEWCASEYNTIGCVNAGAEELIYNSDNTKQLMLNDTAVYGKDVLAAGAAYVFITIPVEEPSTEEPNEHGTTVTVNQYSEEDNDYGTTVIIGEEDEAVNLISFSVDSKTYQAEDGMTWEEWVDSEYNTDGYYLGGGIVLQPGGVNVLDSDGDQQISTDTIKANEVYKHGSYSGGSGN